MSNPVIDSMCNKRRYNADGQYHRLDGPAIEWADGTKLWYLYGKELTEAEHYAQTCVYQFIMQKPNTVETAP